MVKERHQVTVITGNSELKLPLDGKKIGLLQEEGIAFIVLDTGRPHPQKAVGCDESRRFARRALRQGRKLPHFDLVLASSPPLPINRPAYALSCFNKAPLILEVRAMGSFPLHAQESPLKKLLAPPLQRTVLKAYQRARSIIVTSPETAAAAAGITPGKEVHFLPLDLDFDTLFEQFNRILGSIFYRQNQETT